VAFKSIYYVTSLLVRLGLETPTRKMRPQIQPAE
jgi:hypothetical protein